MNIDLSDQLPLSTDERIKVGVVVLAWLGLLGVALKQVLHVSRDFNVQSCTHTV